MDEEVAQDPQEEAEARAGSFELSYKGRPSSCASAPCAWRRCRRAGCCAHRAAQHPAGPLPQRLVAGIVRSATDQPIAIGEVHLESARGWDLIVSPDKLAAYLTPTTVPVVEPPLRRNANPK